MVRVIAFLAGAVLLLPQYATAYTVVLKDGTRIEARATPRITGRRVTFVDSTGRRRALPLMAMDFAAIRTANIRPQTPADTGAARFPVAVSVVGSPVALATPTPQPSADDNTASLPNEGFREYWQDRLFPLNGEIQQIDAQLETIRTDMRTGGSNTIDLTATTRLGVTLEAGIRLLGERRDELEDEIEALRNRARLAGVQPGWVR